MSENKTVFEQLEEVQKELKDLKEKQKTLVDQLNEDDPKIIEFVKRANRVWRYSYEKSDLKRKNNKNKKSSIMGLVLLAIYFIVPFFFITKEYTKSTQNGVQKKRDYPPKTSPSPFAQEAISGSRTTSIPTSVPRHALR
jgi:hypothetical protein